MATSSTSRATSPATGAANSGTYNEVRWSGIHRLVELAQRHLEDALGFGAQALEHHHPSAGGHRRFGALVEGQLDLGEHVGRVALGHQQRPALAGGVDPEPLAVDHPHAAGDRIDAQAGPGQVEERQGRHHLDLEVVVGRRPRHQRSTVRSATTGEPGTA